MATPPEVMVSGPEVTKLSKLSTYRGRPQLPGIGPMMDGRQPAIRRDPALITNEFWMANKSASASGTAD